MTCHARFSLRLSSLALLIAALPLAACHKSEEAPPAAGAAPAATAPATAPAAAPAAPATPATPATPLKVVSLTIGKSVGSDNKVSAEADTFAPGDTVYAAVGTTGGSPAAKLTARWATVSRSGAEKPAGDETKTIAPAGDAMTEFHLVKPGGLTTGDYMVKILLDGKSVATKAFRVSK
ncbi:MAG: hypothetical protein JOZ15_01330 [Acidobacteria bacterium]|nr:hypothetical protein [Acidobacteriota bacterium]